MVERPSASANPTDGPLTSRGPLSARGSLRTAVVGDLLRAALADLTRGADAGPGEPPAAVTGAAPVFDVVDVGGGTGGFAVPLAELGHRVTVVDPSPDALAALERRASERGVVDRVQAVQGDVSGLLEVVAADSADVVLAHGVLEYVDDPAAALTAVTAVLRPGGLASVLVAQRLAAVVSRALSGRFTEARTALTDPAGRWGPSDPLPRRFDQDRLVALVEAAGLALRDIHGVRVFTDLVPGALVDTEPGAAQALLDLEAAVADHPTFVGFAAQLHVLARRN